MKIAIMQPYFLPYIGYFQLIHAVKAFVLYDNIQFTKRGWIRRNRILSAGRPAWITLPLEHASDYLDIRERRLAHDFDRERMLRQIRASYARAPQFAAFMPVLERIIAFENANLFDFLYHSIECLRAYLRLDTRLVVASTLPVDTSLRKQERVIATVLACGAQGYVNPASGRVLYSKDAFAACGLTLEFLCPAPSEYGQFSGPHVANLSIVDLLMFADQEAVSEQLQRYHLV